MSAIDYRSIFTRYWSEATAAPPVARGDYAALINRLLKVCGGGSVLDVGCGAGELVRALLARGIDAKGVDIAAQPIEQANRQCPGRFVAADALALPCETGAFETIVSVHLLDKLDPGDIPAALAEFRRAARRNLYLVVRTDEQTGGDLRRTVLDRAGWEKLAFQAGFRKHPRTQVVFDFESLESDGPAIALALERIPDPACERYPLAALAAERDLHMDMLRESGRRSDAHIARYTLALPFVRPGDTVLDVACGLGYGSAIVAQSSLARRVIGIDNSAYAIEYARTNFACNNSACEFHLGDAAGLAMLPNASVDLIVCMETLEHVPAPEQFLAELDRVLRPSGRLIVSVPNQWVDETGRDPNPHHLSVYDWPKLSKQLSKHFLLETAFAQTAGGALKCRDQTRKLKALAPQSVGDADPEWWIAVAMKSPTGAAATERAPYAETSFPDWSNAADCHIAAFARDYDNPWLVKAMVSIGMRATQPALLEQLASETLQTARPGSADAGAALCVLAYRLLETPCANAAAIQHHIERIAAYHAQADDKPHAWRWRISNEYIAGRLWMNLGNRAAARASFLACAALDALRFSPLLATKTVDALFLAGLLAASDGDLSAARDCWQRGLSETRRVLQGDWRNVWGALDSPASFGLPEVAQLADLATRCSFGLNALEYWQERPGLAWVLAQTNQARELGGWRQMAAELRQWAQESNQGRTWLEGQVRAWRTAAESNGQQVAEREATIRELRGWVEKLEEGKSWLEGQKAAFEAEAGRVSTALSALQARYSKLADEGPPHDAQVEQTREMEIAQQRSKLALAQGELAALRSEHAGLQEQLRQSQQETGALREKVQMWKKQLAYRALRKLAVVQELESD